MILTLIVVLKSLALYWYCCNWIKRCSQKLLLRTKIMTANYLLFFCEYIFWQINGCECQLIMDYIIKLNAPLWIIVCWISIYSCPCQIIICLMPIVTLRIRRVIPDFLPSTVGLSEHLKLLDPQIIKLHRDQRIWGCAFYALHLCPPLKMICLN